MLSALALLALLAGGPVQAPEDAQVFTGKDGVVWTVRSDARLSEGEHEATTHHVLRQAPGEAAREVATFTSSSFRQHNPTMSGSTRWKFRLGKGGALECEQTSSESRRYPDGRTTTKGDVTVFTWNGSKFVSAPSKK